MALMFPGLSTLGKHAWLGNNVSWFVHLRETWIGNNVSWFVHLRETWIGNNVSWFVHLGETYMARKQLLIFGNMARKQCFVENMHAIGNSVSWRTWL
jgi:hypothetical protein